MTHFSANINRIALLRNSRDNGLPDLVACARIVLDAGADGITVHPRPDERHIRASDMQPIAAGGARVPLTVSSTSRAIRTTIWCRL